MHRNEHEDEKRQFINLLGQLGMGHADERMAFLDAFLNSEEHHTTDGWQKFMRRRGLRMDRHFVDENLELLTRLGMATKREFDDGAPRFEHQHLGEHHDHMICTSCGAIEEFCSPELERLQEEVARQHGFHHLRHRMQIYGLCRDCLAKCPDVKPLTATASGERVRVENLPHGEHAAARLMSMGLCKGVEVDVLSAGHGPVVVAVRGTRLALGRGEAEKIKVSRISR